MQKEVMEEEKLKQFEQFEEYKKVEVKELEEDYKINILKYGMLLDKMQSKQEKKQFFLENFILLSRKQLKISLLNI